MTAGVPKHQLDSDLAQALRHLGLGASVETKSGHPAGGQASIKVRAGKDKGTVVS